MRRWLVAGLAILVALTVGVAGFWLVSPEAQTTAAKGTIPIGGSFSLLDQNGRRVTEQDFRGRFMLVYFGYTFCPDVCPLGLQTLTQAVDDLPAELRERVVPVFITVDPERDTVAVMKDYVASFGPRLVGLTGSPAETGQASRAWRVYAHKGEAKDGVYLVDHSTFTYLMGPDGAYVTHFGHDVTPEAMAQRTADAIRGS
ncbi:MAG: SCO family protein [Geminicoccaceae bacterium]